MNLLQKAFLALRQFGVQTVIATAAYTRSRDRWNASIERPSEAPPLPPGPLRQARQTPGGAYFEFQNTELEIIFLAADLVRLTWGHRALPIPYAISAVEEFIAQTTAVRLEETASGHLLASPSLHILVRGDGGLSYSLPGGELLREDLPPVQTGERWSQQSRMQPAEAFYGLGERAAPLNLRGGSYRMWNTDAGIGYLPGSDPLYLCIPAYLAIHPQGSYLIFYENSFDAAFDLRGEEALSKVSFANGSLRFYIAAATPAQAIARYSELTGRAPLPPRWALGYHQSRWGYKTEADIRAVAAGFRERNLPLSAIHLDIDYMDGYRVFTVNAKRFPDLRRLAGDLAAQGVRLVTIIDPGVKQDPTYFAYRDGLQEGHFCTLPDGKPAIAPVWPGPAAFPDFTNPAARRWWSGMYTRLLDQGIAGFWHDMNEPAAFAAGGDLTLPLPTRHHLDGQNGDHRQAHNLYGLLMARAGYEGLRQLRPDQRPWIVTRSGWAGLQRYAWNWTGDIETSWKALRQTISTVLNLGLSGQPYSGPDTGGFSGNPTSELYLRWMQLACFLPFFRTHSSLDTTRREPWCFDEPTTRIAGDFLRLRYRLMPYIYTLAWQAAESGAPLVRPLFWPDGDDPTLWNVDDEFLLGDALLAAPVVEQGKVGRAVALPKGDWYNFWDDTRHAEPSVLTVSAPVDRIPLFVRAGSVLPMEDGERLTLHIYPPAAETAQPSLLYSDAGDGYGPNRIDRFMLRRPDGDPARIEITWESEGEYPFPYPQVSVQLHGAAILQAQVDGQEAACLTDRVETGVFRVLELQMK